MKTKLFIHKTRIFLDFEVPKLCPYCNKSGIPTAVGDYLANDGFVDKYNFLFQYSNCNNIFFAKYIDPNWEPQIYPPPVPPLDLPPEMETIAPEFHEIYQQAYKAEKENLDKISGMGYRKSIEFLIKPYVLSFSDASDKDKILSEPLSATIGKIKDDNIRALALASTWLGNDQTHYVPKHPEYDIAELKNYIKYLCHSIVTDYYSAKARELLSRK